VTAADLLVLAPWLIFGAALAAICYHLLSRRGGRWPAPRGGHGRAAGRANPGLPGTGPPV